MTKAKVVPGTATRQGRIGTPFGYKSKTNPNLWKRGFHPGDDWSTLSGQADVGIPSCSGVNGTVIWTGWGANHRLWGEAYGYLVLIKDSRGHVNGSCHLSKITCKVGQKVKAGDQVGLVGATGSGAAAGPHTHYETRQSPFGYYNSIKPVYDDLPEPPLPSPQEVAEKVLRIDGIVPNVFTGNSKNKFVSVATAMEELGRKSQRALALGQEMIKKLS